MPGRQFLCGICLLAVMAVAGPAGAAVAARLDLGRLEYRGFTVSNVEMQMSLAGQNAAPLVIFAKQLQFGSTVVLEQLKLVCGKTQLGAEEFQCSDARLNARDPEGGKVRGRVSVVYRFDGSVVDLSVTHLTFHSGKFSARFVRRAQAWHAQVHGAGLSLSWLQGVVKAAGLWPAGYSQASGRVNVDVTADGEGSALEHARGALQTMNFGLNGPDSAEKLSSHLKFSVEKASGLEIKTQGALTGGLLYVAPGIRTGDIEPGIAIEVPSNPITFTADLNWDASKRHLLIRRAGFSHPGIVTARFVGDLELGGKSMIRSAAISLNRAELGKLYINYLQPFLLNTSFNSLKAAGDLSANVSIRNNRLRNLVLQFHDVHAYDGQNRFSVAGLNGDLRVHAASSIVRSTLHWAGIGVYRLNFGAGSLALESSKSDVKVVKWADMPLLDGALKISSLSVTHAGRRDMRIDLDGGITPVSMAELTQSLGWPVMSGKLTGKIRGLHYQYGNLTLDGHIDVGIFGGRIDVSRLHIDDLFGVVPVLRADVDIKGIRLKQLTDRFSFGSIQGTLDGWIHNLELQDWRPVSFDAKVETPRDDPARHRISQRAVNNLGLIGGGASGALSGGLLRFFKEYSYGRLGIGCRLYNGVCELSGVKDTPDGFMILTSGGLLPPWIEIKGTGHSISWNTLVNELRAITNNPAQIRTTTNG